MPGSHHYKEDPYVRCPYYCKDAPIEIKCKGLCGMHTLNVFANGKEKRAFKEDFCMGNYHGCPLYIGLVEDGK